MSTKKIYILADMEGISGIRTMAQVDSSTSEYEEGRRLMMADINAAVEGAIRGGATEVIAADCHGGGGQLRMEEMDPRASYEFPAPGNPMPSLDETFSGLILLGHHAKAGTINGFLDHTMNSRAWFEYRLNDQVVGEIGIEAAVAGHYNVPVIMVSGDEATSVEAKATLGEVETAIVKWGLGRNRARCLQAERARQLVTEATARAVRDCERFKPFKPGLPATVQITYYRTDMAEEYAFRNGVERIDARTVRRTVTAFNNLYNW